MLDEYFEDGAVWMDVKFEMWKKVKREVQIYGGLSKK